MKKIYKLIKPQALPSLKEAIVVHFQDHESNKLIKNCKHFFKLKDRYAQS